MPIGRLRLAQFHYECALEHLTNDNQNMALWHANMALHGHPRLMDAVRLKERITQHREWDADGSGSRAFLHQLIAEEKGYDLNLFDRPRPATMVSPDSIDFSGEATPSSPSPPDLDGSADGRP